MFLGEISALIAAAIWAASSMMITYVSQKIGSLQANMTRMLVALCFFVAAILLFRLPMQLSSTQLFYFVISSLIGIVLGDTFLFKAFQRIGARLSMLVMAFSPAISALLAWLFLDETLSPLGIFGIFVTLGGIALVVLERREQTPQTPHLSRSGLIYAALGALGQGVGVIFVKLAFAEGAVNGFVASFLRILAAAIFLLPMLLLMKQYRNPLPQILRDKRLLFLIVLSSFLGAFLGISLSLIAIKYTEVGIASTLMATSPVVMLPMVRVAYNERLSWKTIGGACIAVSGVAMLFLFD